MQRRAAAAYVVLFLVIAAGAFAFVSTAEPPAVSIENPDHTLQQNSTLTVDGREYRVTDVSASSGGGGGHGGGGVTYEAVLVWTNESAQFSETWANNSTVTYQNTTYRAFIANTSQPSEITLRWEPGDRFSPQWQGNTQYIDSQPDAPDRQAVTVEEYIAANANNSSLQPVTIPTNQPLNYNGNQTSINATNEQAVLTWTAPQDNEVTFGQNENVTLNGVEFAAHFPNENTVQLGQGTEKQLALQEAIASEERFHERMNGFWGVVILASVGIVLLVTLAYLPRKE
ncbi:hypothetical protein [Haloarchaeobius sp. HRN-SO-5]|uniref:hypothetical protein n=1 Tax=Haloarchaeobius sp. HRN-SO-5 TaxID=3446118 RepID=UPI003EB6AC89